MTYSVNSNSSFYADTASLKTLKAKASSDAASALEMAAEQFESMFIHMMLKSMRSTTSGDGIFDSDHSLFYQEMYDQQLSVEMAKQRQVGISDMLIQQLGGKGSSGSNNNFKSNEVDLAGTRLHRPLSHVALEAFAPINNTSQESIKQFESPRDFITKLWPLAEKYAAELGVEPKVLLAQSALETGWGKYVIRYTNGVPTHNLFNIKADSRWDGPKAVVPTLEYENGRLVRQYAAFRTYPTFEDSFIDYVDFIKSGDRYQPALDNATDSREFVRALHLAGYATDPKYHLKINKIMDSDVFEQPVLELKSLIN